MRKPFTGRPSHSVDDERAISLGKVGKSGFISKRGMGGEQVLGPVTTQILLGGFAQRDVDIDLAEL
jgi:hypothetical protein